MEFHNRNLFLEDYAPIPFCYPVRRPQHAPEGVISVEQVLGTLSHHPPPNLASAHVVFRRRSFDSHLYTRTKASPPTINETGSWRFKYVIF
jgi:hypothetical protein